MGLRNLHRNAPTWLQGLALLSLAASALSGGAARLAAFQEAADEANGDVEAAAAKVEPARTDDARAGTLIRIAGAINDQTDQAVRKQVDAAISRAKKDKQWPVLVLELQSGESDVYHAHNLAHYLSGSAVAGATTVAWLPKPLSGHNVLVAMACDEIVMHPDANIGNAGIRDIDPDGSLPEHVRVVYEEVAGRRNTIPRDLALGMLDPQLEVLIVETENSREFVRRDRLEALRAEKAVGEPQILKPRGAPGVLAAGKARALGVASYLAEDRAALATALRLNAGSLRDDPSLEGGWRPVRIEVRNHITGELVAQVQKMIQKQIRDRDSNLFFLCIDSPGGSALDSINLANFLAGLDSVQRKTVAYVAKEARGDAAFIALACDDIVMGPDAVLGGSGSDEIREEDLQNTVKAVTEIARQKLRPMALAAALVDPQLTVYRYTRQKDGVVDYFTEADVDARQDGNAWRKGEAVKKPGKPLEVSGKDALQLNLAKAVVDDLAGLNAEYGLTGEIALVEPGWADELIDALSSPQAAWFLLMVGIVGMYVELHSPGVGLGGLVAMVCFLLYFWGAFLGGTATGLEVLLFVAGLVFLMLEMFVVPGFGLFGIGGGMMVIISLVLASQTFVLPHNDYQIGELYRTLLVLVGVGVGTGLAVAGLRRYLPHAPMLNRMVLAPLSREEASDIAQREALAQWDHLLGMRGTTVTPLMPGGKARFGDELVDVIAAGEFVERGHAVEVKEVRGNRVVVSEIG